MCLDSQESQLLHYPVNCSLPQGILILTTFMFLQHLILILLNCFVYKRIHDSFYIFAFKMHLSVS